jgi:glycosyltransferase involved in cell wall biosynthesis
MKILLSSSRIDKDKFVVIPNFVQDSYRNFNFKLEKNNRWVAAGRLTEEKGFQELIEYWPDKYSLDIYGNGQLLQRLKKLVELKENINIKGSLSRDDFVKILPTYTGAIMPSKWYEPGPLVVLEYLAAGLPVISIGAWSEAAGLDLSCHVEMNAGKTICVSTRLEEKIDHIENNSIIFSNEQRKKYLEGFTPAKWYERFLNVLTVQ